MFPLRIFAFQPRIVIAAAISLAALTVTTLFLYQVHAQPAAALAVGEVVSGASGMAYLSTQEGAGLAAVSAATITPPMLEMHIANNGAVLLRGAQVISTSGGTIEVGMRWNSVQFTWAVRTNSNAFFFNSKGEKEISPTIPVGDVVTVTGMLIANGPQPTINAEYIDTE